MWYSKIPSQIEEDIINELCETGLFYVGTSYRRLYISKDPTVRIKLLRTLSEKKVGLSWEKFDNKIWKKIPSDEIFKYLDKEIAKELMFHLDLFSQ